MRRELEQKLVERWPSWFNVTGNQRETRMADGFAHGNGWFNIVWRLCEDLEPLVAEAEKVTGHPFGQWVSFRLMLRYSDGTETDACGEPRPTKVRYNQLEWIFLRQTRGVSGHQRVKVQGASCARRPYTNHL